MEAMLESQQRGWREEADISFRRQVEYLVNTFVDDSQAALVRLGQILESYRVPQDNASKVADRMPSNIEQLPPQVQENLRQVAEELAHNHEGDARFADTQKLQRDLWRGAQNAVKCMGIKDSDRVFLLTDESRQPLADLIAAAANLDQSNLVVRQIESYSERPITSLPGALRDEITEFHPTVTYLLAQSKEGELPFRIELRAEALDKLNVRHGHMPGFSPELMSLGMAADYDRIYERTRQIYGIVKDAKSIHVTSPNGTEVKATFLPHRKWVPSDGRYHEQGKWGNLPEGETFTAPYEVEGVIVANILGDYFSEEYGVLQYPLKFHIHKDEERQRSEIYLITSDYLEEAKARLGKNYKDDPEAAKIEQLISRLNNYLDQDPNGRRVGEFAIGTNEALREVGFIGNLLQDEKFPGLHVAFGDPYPHETGADWEAKTHIDVIPEQCTIEVDRGNGPEMIMKDGVFTVDLPDQEHNALPAALLMSQSVAMLSVPGEKRYAPAAQELSERQSRQERNMEQERLEQLREQISRDPVIQFLLKLDQSEGLNKIDPPIIDTNLLIPFMSEADIRGEEHPTLIPRTAEIGELKRLIVEKASEFSSGFALDEGQNIHTLAQRIRESEQLTPEKRVILSTLAGIATYLQLLDSMEKTGKPGINYDDYALDTMGFTPEMFTETELEEQQRRVQETLVHAQEADAGRPESERELAELKPDEVLDQSSGFLKGALPEFVEYLDMSGLRVGYGEDFALKTENVDQRRIARADTLEKGPDGLPTVTVTLNVHPRHTWRRSRGYNTGAHEILGHVTQDKGWQAQIRAGNLNPEVGILAIASPLLFLQEGIADTFELFMPSDRNPATPAFHYERERSHLERMVFNNAFYLMNHDVPGRDARYTTEELVRYVQDNLRGYLTERELDDKLIEHRLTEYGSPQQWIDQIYYQIYPRAQHFLRKLRAQMTEPEADAFVKAVYSKPYTPIDLGTWLESYRTSHEIQ